MAYPAVRTRPPRLLRGNPRFNSRFMDHLEIATNFSNVRNQAYGFLPLREFIAGEIDAFRAMGNASRSSAVAERTTAAARVDFIRFAATAAKFRSRHIAAASNKRICLTRFTVNEYGTGAAPDPTVAISVVSHW